MTADTPILRPLSLGELLDQAVRLYRRNFWKFVGIIALVSVPLNLISLILSASGLFVINPTELGVGDTASLAAYFGFLGLALVIGVITLFIVNGFGAAALARAIADARMGVETGVFTAYSQIKSRIPHILIAVTATVVLFIVLFAWMIIPCIGWASGPVLLLFWMNVLWPLVIPIVVIERKNTGLAIRRAWDLARRRFWWVLGFFFVLYLLTWILTSGPASLASYLTTLLLGSRMSVMTAEQIATLVQSVVSVLISVFVVPLQITATILMYFDLRVRTEGLDLALQTSAQGEGVTMSDLLAAAPAASSEKLVTGREIGYFAALMVIMVLVTGILFVLSFGLMSLMFGTF